MNVTLVGDGQMALVLADALTVAGARVRLWGPFSQDIQKLGQTRRSPRLAGFELPPRVELSDRDETALDGAGVVINAIPTQFIHRVWLRLGAKARHDVPILCVSKGIENETLRRPSEVIEAAVAEAGGRCGPICAMSGPTIAAELARRLPAAMVAACDDPSVAETAQDLLDVPWLRVYRHDDLLGVELAGATKNVIALAAGMLDGLDAGDNAKSALLARGLAEIARLGVAMGAKIDTFFGIAGVGDLATTCFSPSGRNRSCGERLGRGEELDDVLGSMTSIVEGVPTTRSVSALARRHGVEMPITAAVHGILFEGLDPREAIERLMSRERKAERIG